MVSIRRELLLTLTPAVLLLMAAAVWAVLHEVNDEIGELYDAQLVQAAFAVPAAAPPAAAHRADDPMRELVIAVWEPGAAQPVFRSRIHAPLSKPTLAGFSLEKLRQDGWRVYTRQDGERWIQAAQPLRVRGVASREFISGVAAPLLLLVPLVIITVLWLVKRGLRPLTHFTGELNARAPSSFDPLPVQALPAELLPMAAAMNRLIVRLQEALKGQEVFVADAAHELLTPLTALQVQVQMLERAKSDERRIQAADDVRVSLERCINLARQLLSLARHSPTHPAPPAAALLLGDAVRAAVSEVLPKAHQRHIDLGITSEVPANIIADEKAIQTLLSNLLDNAVKYSPESGRVDVSIALRDERPVILVSDSGPGIPAAEQARVFDRFYRGSAVDAEGSGLGLAIAREIAERHAIRLELSTPGRLGGLDMHVVFPAAARSL